MMISIVIPIYNAEKYLQECLKSIQNQTYSNFECLLLDDGSTDSSGAVCDEFCAKDSRFKVFHNRNHGVSYSRNFGLQQAQGEFITFVDSDDLIDQTMLEKLIVRLTQSDADVCFCKYDEFDDEGQYAVVESKLDSATFENDSCLFHGLLKYFFLSLSKNNSELIMGAPWRILFRKDKIRFGFDEEIRICEDLLFVLNNLAGLNTVEVVNEALYHYRRVANSASRRYKKDFLTNQTMLIKAMSAFWNQLDLVEKENHSVLDVEYAVHVYYLFSNEIKYRKLHKETFKQNIKEYKNADISRYFTLRNFSKIQNKKLKIKYALIFLITKLGLYHLL